MVAAKARYGLASAPGTRFSTRRLFGLEQVVVLDVGAGDREVVVVLRPRRLVRLGEQVELELGAQERLEAERPRPLDLALQDPAGRLLLRLAVLGVDIAEHERRLLEPGDPPQRAEVRDRVEVAVAGGPAGETVAGLRVHLDVAPEQVGAGVHPPARDLLEEVVGRHPLPHQPPEHVRDRGQDRVDLAPIDQLRQLLERQHPPHVGHLTLRIAPILRARRSRSRAERGTGAVRFGASLLGS
jgi:hypothetical protein